MNIFSDKKEQLRVIWKVFLEDQSWLDLICNINEFTYFLWSPFIILFLKNEHEPKKDYKIWKNVKHTDIVLEVTEYERIKFLSPLFQFVNSLGLIMK